MREPTFELYVQPFGKVAVLRDGLSQDALEYFKKSAAKDRPLLSFSYGDFEDLSFLKPHLNWIRFVSINNCELMDWAVLNELEKLNALSVSQRLDTNKFDPCRFPNLRWLEYFWNKDMENKVPELKSLTSIRLNGYKAKDLFVIEGLKKLVNVELTHSRTLSDIGSIATLRKLQFVMLAKNSKLGDLSPLAACKSIKSLSLDGNKNSYAFESLSSLNKLEELELVGDFSSATWIADLVKLKKLRLRGHLEDGDLSFLKDMPSLQVLTHSNKRNNNLSEKETMAMMKERGFDQDKLDSKMRNYRSFPHMTAA